MVQPSPAQNLPRVTIRMEEDFRQKLMEAAYHSDRSLNAEIMARLEKSFEDDAEEVATRSMVAEHDDRIADLERAIEDLQHNMGEIISHGGPSRDMR